MTEPLRYGVIGTAGYGATHAGCVTALDNADVVAGAATSESSLDPSEAEHSATRYTDHVEMFAAEDLDAVSV